MEWPERVTMGSDGVYRWTCETDREIERRSYKITMWVCGGIVLFLVFLGTLMDRETLIITLACGAVVMVIAALVCWLFDRLPGTLRERYEMAEDYIRIATNPKGSAWFTYPRIRRVTVRRDRLELKKRIVSVPVFVPHEDFGFVRDYILRRVSEDTEIIYGDY